MTGRRGGHGYGRGAYYRAKYGGKGRGGRNPGDESMNVDQLDLPQPSQFTQDWHSLHSDLQALNGAQYGAYKRLQGRTYMHDAGWKVVVDHVQGDAYAPPSKARVSIPLRLLPFGPEYTKAEPQSRSLKDYINRRTVHFLRSLRMDEDITGGGVKGGAVTIYAPGQEVLDRTSCVIAQEQQTMELRLTISLPARGRSILGPEVTRMFTERLPELAERVIMLGSKEKPDISKHLDAVLAQTMMRAQLAEKGLVSFIANGSILPRQSGITAQPMTDPSVVPFESPPTLSVTLKLPDGSDVQGMGIPRGVTVLTGGGFHGKSTLLEAIQLGVYDHVPGDGRERVATDASACKVRAEDGRSVAGVDLTPFVADLPGGRAAAAFATADASGSTSMAAGIQEALELRCTLLLVDEDKAATNLLVRDRRMRALVAAEPLTPLVARARALHAERAASIVLVVGGCGDYLSIADTVVGMHDYRAADLSAAAADVVARFPAELHVEETYGAVPARAIRVPRSAVGDRRPAARGHAFVKLTGAEADGIDLAAVEQVVEAGQAAFAAEVLHALAGAPEKSLAEMVDGIEAAVEAGGLDAVVAGGPPPGDLARLRPMDVGAVINRVRGLEARAARQQ